MFWMMRWNYLASCARMSLARAPDARESPMNRARCAKAASIFPVLMVVFITSGFLAGCGTLSNGRGWGQDATLFPGVHRIRDAALNSALDPRVWVPASGALVLQVDHMDERLSEWAVEHTPVFGSNQNADDASDYLRDAAAAGYLATALLTPSGEDEKEWLVAKFKGLGVGIGAISLTVGANDLLKGAIGRERPDGSDQRSMPSGHASFTAACATLGSRNVDSLHVPRGGKIALKTGFEVISLITGWSRVEAGVHYPSDVLVGMALGNFLAGFINDAFLGINPEDDFRLAVQPAHKGAMVSLSWRF